MKNEYEVFGNTVAIYVSCKGDQLATFIDLDDLEKVLAFENTWIASKSGKNIYCTIRNKGKIVSLHRLIADTPLGYITDHINHNTLDNRKSNLRNVTYVENGRNKSGYTKTKQQLFRTDWNPEYQMYSLKTRKSENEKFIIQGFYYSREEARNKAKEII